MTNEIKKPIYNFILHDGKGRDLPLPNMDIIYNIALYYKNAIKEHKKLLEDVKLLEYHVNNLLNAVYWYMYHYKHLDGACYDIDVLYSQIETVVRSSLENIYKTKAFKILPKCYYCKWRSLYADVTQKTASKTKDIIEELEKENYTIFKEIVRVSI